MTKMGAAKVAPLRSGKGCAPRLAVIMRGAKVLLQLKEKVFMRL
jgi:hypothetical protein